MRAVIQRVKKASVTIDEKKVSEIDLGMLIFFGAGAEDDPKSDLVERFWEKIARLRIFADAEGKTNLNMDKAGADVLIVPQFTLYASCRKGNRPSFTDAAPPAIGEALYDRFVEAAEKTLGREVQTGVFGADMKVELLNDGPFTIVLDTDELFN